MLKCEVLIRRVIEGLNMNLFKAISRSEEI